MGRTQEEGEENAEEIGKIDVKHCIELQATEEKFNENNQVTVDKI